MRSLTEFINKNPHPKELKRALAIKMVEQGYKHQQIQKILGVSSGFISKWKRIFKDKGLEALKLSYKGSKGYLSNKEKQEIINCLKEKATWNLKELEYHIAKNYDLVFKSKQSYYDLFKAAGISWKKSQKKNPKYNSDLVSKKKRII